MLRKFEDGTQTLSTPIYLDCAKVREVVAGSFLNGRPTSRVMYEDGTEFFVRGDIDDVAAEVNRGKEGKP